MRFKCPHCTKVTDYSKEDLRKIFLSCPGCGRQFRPNETSPLISTTRQKDSIDNALSAMTTRMHAQGIRQHRASDSRRKGEMAVNFLNSKGISLYRQKRYPEAREVFAKSLRLNPDQDQIRKLMTLMESEDRKQTSA